MKFILLTNVKMPTIVGILTFMSRINTASARSLEVSAYSFIAVEISCSVEMRTKKKLGARLIMYFEYICQYKKVHFLNYFFN